MINRGRDFKNESSEVFQGQFKWIRSLVDFSLLAFFLGDFPTLVARNSIIGVFFLVFFLLFVLVLLFLFLGLLELFFVLRFEFGRNNFSKAF